MGANDRTRFIASCTVSDEIFAGFALIGHAIIKFIGRTIAQAECGAT